MGSITNYKLFYSMEQWCGTTSCHGENYLTVCVAPASGRHPLTALAVIWKQWRPWEHCGWNGVHLRPLHGSRWPLDHGKHHCMAPFHVTSDAPLLVFGRPIMPSGCERGAPTHKHKCHCLQANWHCVISVTPHWSELSFTQ